MNFRFVPTSKHAKNTIAGLFFSIDMLSKGKLSVIGENQGRITVAGQPYPRYGNVGSAFGFHTAKSKEHGLAFGCAKGELSFHTPVSDFVILLHGLLGHLISISTIPADREVVNIRAH